jgi:hypothetical protein
MANKPRHRPKEMNQRASNKRRGILPCPPFSGGWGLKGALDFGYAVLAMFYRL